jgi:hypothetical protein
MYKMADRGIAITTNDASEHAELLSTPCCIQEAYSIQDSYSEDGTSSTETRNLSRTTGSIAGTISNNDGTDHQQNPEEPSWLPFPEAEQIPKRNSDSSIASEVSHTKPNPLSGSTQPVPMRSTISKLLTSWRSEMTVWLLGTLAFTTMVVLLTHFHNQPASKWKSKIQITTMVSILSQFAQSALLMALASGVSQLKWAWFQQVKPLEDMELFDKASRGPEGSIQFIYRFLPFTNRTRGTRKEASASSDYAADGVKTHRRP